MQLLDQIVRYARETAVLESVAETLEWDERTYMPPAGGAHRAEQLTLLHGVIHARKVDGQYGEWLGEAESAAEQWEEDDRATVRVLLREFRQQRKVPQQLVEALTRNSIEGQQAWVTARAEDDFRVLQPYLEQTVKLKREQADALGFEDCAYDALLDQYEPEEKTHRVREVFQSLRDQLVELLQSIQGSGQAVSTAPLRGAFDVERQRQVGRAAATRIGFDFSRGRLDETNHPFCTSLGPADVRLTTRYDESFFSSAFFGTLHEAGHGIYEQGLRSEAYGLPPGKYTSMAIHESQSRLWENCVGRSRAFWRHFYPELRQAFPETLESYSDEDFYLAVNHVEPSLIRVEADEVTYNLHIIVRFELEQELLDGTLQVADAPAAWHDRYQQFLGLQAPNDADGVLQDIHWSAAYFGYFPTYALGNLYAAQFLEQAARDLGDLNAMWQEGAFEPLRGWLEEKIHARGQCDSAAQLVQRVTGKPLSDQPLLAQLRRKYAEIYNL